MGQALADRSNVVIEDDVTEDDPTDETTESELEPDVEESEADELTGLADNPQNGAEPPESAEVAEPMDPASDSGYPRLS
jgi:hypothetical protein